MEKNFLKKKYFQSETYYILILLLGFFSGIPFSWNIMSSSISINYIYFLFFIIFLFYEKINLKINYFFYLAMAYYLIVYFLNFLQFDLDILLLRKTFSFIIFIVPFFFFIFIVNKKTIDSLKYSIIFVSIFYGLLTIYWYFEFLYLTAYDPTFNHALKYYIGGSRMGFFHIVAFYLILEKIFEGKNNLFYLLFFINTAAIYNTYSRTSLVAILISSLIFIYISFKNKNIFKFSKKFLILFLVVLLNLPFFHKTTIFYDKKFFNLIINTTASKINTTVSKIEIPFLDKIENSFLDKFKSKLFSNSFKTQNKKDVEQKHKNNKNPYEKDKFLEFDNPKSSEGYRILIWKKMINYLHENGAILHGSGYVGSFVVDKKMKFSSHSQYFDIFFRTGIIGLSICLIIYFIFLNKFRKRNYYLFSSFVGVLIYGFFHETFKLSQGGVLLMFFILYFNYEKHYLNKND